LLTRLFSLIGVEDPPRDGVSDSVRQLRQGGVKVLMITGDSKETALAIAQRCGILGDDGNGGGGLNDLLLTSNFKSFNSSSSDDVESGASDALSGSELDAIPPDSLADSIVGVRVFYRVVPRHKLAIVRALQEQGEIVAMTGTYEFELFLTALNIQLFPHLIADRFLFPDRQVTE